MVDGQNGDLTLLFTPGTGAALGMYDLKAELDDGDNVTTYVYPNRITVRNNLPVLGRLELTNDTVYRGDEVTGYLRNVTDVETPFYGLEMYALQRLNGTMEWNFSMISYEGVDGSMFNFGTGFTSAIGYYDLLIVINDTDIRTEHFYPNAILVLNNPPLFTGLEPGSSGVFRNETITMTIENISDMESSVQDMGVNISYRPNGTVDWNTEWCSGIKVSGNDISVNFTPPVSPVLGKYDFLVTLDDGYDRYSIFYPNLLEVLNNPPVISDEFVQLKMWSNTTKEFSLSGMGSDVEDTTGNLVWTINDSSVNKSLIENITINGTTLTITAVKGAAGIDDVEFSLKDRDGGSVSKYIEIEVVPDARRLAAVLLYPGNGTTLSTTEVNLTWNRVSTDPNASVTFNVYFGENLSGVLERDEAYLKGTTSNLYLLVTGLESDITYYWSVIPRNATDTGTCVPPYRCFSVLTENQPPAVELLSPVNGATLNATSVELRWSGSDPENDDLNYFVYLSGSPADLAAWPASALVTDTPFSTYTIAGLEKGKIYFWSVRPFDEGHIGICSSGIWNFTVSQQAFETPEATLSCHAAKIFAGEKVTFTILNSGTRDDLKFRVNFYDGTTSEWTTEKKITHTYEKAGVYPVSLSVLVGQIEAPIPGATVITVIDPAVLELVFVQPVHTDTEFLSISGSIVGVSWLSDNITLSAEVNGRTVDIAPSLSWSGEIPAEYLKEGNNTIFVKLLFKGKEIAREEKSITISISQKTGDEKGISTGIWIGIVVLVIIVLLVLFLVFRRRRKEPSSKKPKEDVVGEVEEAKEGEAEDGGEEVRADGEDQTDGEEDGLIEVDKEDPEEKAIPEPGIFTAPELMPVPPSKEKIIPGYTLTHKLGSGGFATVYRAVDSKGSPVAIKLPKFIDETIDMSVLEKFKAESDIWKKLKHRNIVSFYKGDIRPLPYMVIEYMEGGNLLDRLKGGTFPIDMAISTIQHILSGMAYAHRMASVHRDIKPENILFTPDGVPKISDWGIGKFMASASATKTVGTKGTLAYSSPEQVAKEKFGDIDWSTDVFQLGIVFYEMLTGVNPIMDDDPVTIISNLITRIPVPPSSLRPGIPPEIDAVILRALEKEKDRRFSSADTMLEELKRGLKERDKNVDDYRSMLERAFSDGMISPDEEMMLEGFRKRFGISMELDDEMRKGLNR